MARPARPWSRAARDSWCVDRNGKLVVLCKGMAIRKEAYRQCLALPEKGEKDTRTARSNGRQVCEFFLEHVQVSLKQNT